MVCALWRTDGVLDKCLPSILRTALLLGLSDADPSARRAARMLYWCLHEREDGIFRSELDKTVGGGPAGIGGIGAAGKKHILLEKTNASPDFVELMELVRCPVLVQRGGSGTNGSEKVRHGSGKAEEAQSTPKLSEELMSNRWESNELNPLSMIEDDSPLSLTSSRPSLSGGASTSARRTTLSVSGPLRVSVNSTSANLVTRPGSSQQLRSSTTATNAVLPMPVRVQESEDVDVLAGLIEDDDFANRRVSLSSPRRTSLSLTGPLRVAVSTPGVESVTSTERSSRQLLGGARRVVSSVQAQAQSLPPPPTNHSVMSLSSDNGDTVVPVASPSPEKVLLGRGHPNGSPQRAIRSDMNPSTLSVAVPESSDGGRGKQGTTVKEEATIINSGADYSTDSLKEMLGDSVWNVRLKAAEHIHQQLYGYTMNERSLSLALQEVYVDMATGSVGDVHTKVAVVCMQVLQLCVERLPDVVISRLGNVCVSLFQRLGDRRSNIQSQAQQLLDYIRQHVDSSTLFHNLSPKITEMPDRLRTALFQYLGAIAAHCGSLLNQGSVTGLLLSRLAQVMNKPSTALLQAGRKLLELIYKTSPQVVTSQLSLMPLQQQNLLRKLLEDKVPDIDILVAAASRAEWNSKTSARSDNRAEERDSKRREQKASTLSRKLGLEVQTISQVIDISDEADSDENRYRINAQARPDTESDDAPRKSGSPINVAWLMQHLCLDVPENKQSFSAALTELNRLAASEETNSFWESQGAQLTSMLLDCIVRCSAQCRPAEESLFYQDHVFQTLTGLSPRKPSDSARFPTDTESRTAEQLHVCSNLLLLILRKKGIFIQVGSTCNGQHF
jgi:hypothetical protein